MLSIFRWPFGRQAPGTQGRATIEAIYGAIVAQSRLPVFYREFAVPDTVESRFDMVLLHLWMVLRRMNATEGGNALSQALFDHFCSDMDDNLREMGVGDLTVPKKMQAFGEAFYGRSKAYDAALGDRAALADAVARNILNDPDPRAGDRLAAYVAAAVASLDQVEDGAFQRGAWQFPDPAVQGAAQ